MSDLGERRAEIVTLRQEANAGKGRERALMSRLESASEMAMRRLETMRAMSATLEKKERRLFELESKLQTARDTLSRRDGRIVRLTKEVAERDRLIAERDAMIEEMRQRLDDLELDVELLQTRTGHVEDVLATHRREIGALMKTEPGKKAAETIESESIGRERIES